MEALDLENKRITLSDKIKDDVIIDKIYLYVKDLYEAKCQYLIKKRENNGLKNMKDPKVFIEYSNSCL